MDDSKRVITFHVSGTLFETETGIIVKTLYWPNSNTVRAYVVCTENNPAVIVVESQVISRPLATQE